MLSLFSFTVSSLKKKWKSIRDGLRRHREARQERQKSGAAASVYCSQAYVYERLLDFLRDDDLDENTTSNLSARKSSSSSTVTVNVSISILNTCDIIVQPVRPASGTQVVLVPCSPLPSSPGLCVGTPGGAFDSQPRGNHKPTTCTRFLNL